MWVCEDTHGGSSYFPDDTFSRELAAEQCGVDPEDVSHERGWWARLSDPGYVDQTDWHGPFKSEKLAIDFVYNLYDVDAEPTQVRVSLHGAEENELERELSEVFPKGSFVCVRAYTSKPGEGLRYPDFRGWLLEDARSGGWDVYDIEPQYQHDGRTYVGSAKSVYGFSIERCAQSGFKMDDDLDGAEAPRKLPAWIKR